MLVTEHALREVVEIEGDVLYCSGNFTHFCIFVENFHWHVSENDVLHLKYDLGSVCKQLRNVCKYGKEMTQLRCCSCECHFQSVTANKNTISSTKTSNHPFATALPSGLFNTTVRYNAPNPLSISFSILLSLVNKTPRYLNSFRLGQ